MNRKLLRRKLRAALKRELKPFSKPERRLMLKEARNLIIVAPDTLEGACNPMIGRNKP
jgi:hypothetical protein